MPLPIVIIKEDSRSVSKHNNKSYLNLQNISKPALAIENILAVYYINDLSLCLWRESSG